MVVTDNPLHPDWRSAPSSSGPPSPGSAGVCAPAARRAALYHGSLRAGQQRDVYRQRRQAVTRCRPGLSPGRESRRATPLGEYTKQRSDRCEGLPESRSGLEGGNP
jgi:hypothetical protein